jgi:hypothetical protein
MGPLALASYRETTDAARDPRVKGSTGVACETVKTKANDADILVMSDLVRIALRRAFEGGETVFGRAATPSLPGKVGMT